MTHEPARAAATGVGSAPVPVGQVLRALRVARGVSRDGWAAQLGYSRATVQRWEQGETIPDAMAENALLDHCQELCLFRRYEGGALAGTTLTADRLRAWLAEARLAAGGTSLRPVLVVPSMRPVALSPLADSNAYGALPLPLTSFVGRERELFETAQLLRAGRLLTLTGAGGTGKTRLALVLAEQVQADYADGARFVDLARLDDAGLVAGAIAQSLGVRETVGRPLVETLSASLRKQQLLLVLDNFEHLVTAAPLLHDLLVAAPYLTILVTSRVMLRLSGETEYALPPLPVPDLATLPPLEQLARQPAVALFVARAGAVRPGFRLTVEDARAVAEIVARLDGLPLAIELAAARTKLLPPRALLRRLERRLPLLTGGARNLPARQQTLRDTVAWSVDLLEAAERVLFRRLAIFLGGCTLTAAEAVCNLDGDLDVLAGVASLVDKSLLQCAGPAEGEVRLTMLATIQEFALEQLMASGETDRLTQQHARYFLGLMEQAQRGRSVADQEDWLPEHANISVAFARAAERGEAELGLRFLATQRWYEMAAPAEERRWAERLLEAPRARGRTEVRALALYFAGYMAWSQGDIHAAYRHLTESVEIWQEVDRPHHLALAPSFLALSLAVKSEPRQAQTLAEEAVWAARSSGDPWLVTVTLYNRGRVLATSADDTAAISAFEEALDAAQASRDEFIAACVSVASAAATFRLGDTSKAEALFEELLPIIRAYRDTRHVALVVSNLAFVAARRDDRAGAQSLFVDSLRYGLDHGDLINTAGCLGGLGVCAAQADDLQRAARLFGAAQAAFAATGAVLWPGDRLSHLPWLTAVRTGLGETAFRHAWSAGETLARAEAIALALLRT